MKQTSEVKHTPGPWSFENGDEVILDNEGYGLCDGSRFKNWDANARLIAAAPELLEAAKDCITTFIANGNNPLVKAFTQEGRMARLVSAIAKAEGK